MNSSDVQIVFPGDSDHLGSGYHIFVMVAFSFSLSQCDVDAGRPESQYLLLMGGIDVRSGRWLPVLVRHLEDISLVFAEGPFVQQLLPHA